ncbi:hypothetical protein CTA2_12148 [Colletotrichum tanaceti]|uniref:Uncharacterized protein n=1 Tax=Colletotrichum tanaceti TaxID=1306861 RepID=A0A4U6X026_9PEZI|nr:hypothetical protein CTA2_12148 [Colletotrichum tanaceti]TKW48721.1 hypothetical protein CTA1_2024 [Colletotrichum tanaceti]
MDAEPDARRSLLSIPWRIFCFFVLLPFRVLKYLFFAGDAGGRPQDDGITWRVQVVDVDRARRAYYVGRRREQVDNYWWRCAVENARRKRLLQQPLAVVAEIDNRGTGEPPKKSVQFDDAPEYIPGPAPADDEQVPADGVQSKPEGPVIVPVDEKSAGGEGAVARGGSRGGGILTESEGNLDEVVDSALKALHPEEMISRRRSL